MEGKRNLPFSFIHLLTLSTLLMLSFWSHLHGAGKNFLSFFSVVSYFPILLCALARLCYTFRPIHLHNLPM